MSTDGDAEPREAPPDLSAGALADDPGGAGSPRFAFLQSDFANKIAQTLATEVLLGIVGLLTGILTARVLGPSGKGEFALVTIVVYLVYAFGQLGIAHTVVYFVKRIPPTELVPSALWLSALAGVASLLIGGTVVYVAASGPLELRKPVLAIGLLTIPLLFLDATARALIQGNYLMRKFNLLRLVNPAAFLPLLAAVAAVGDRVQAAVVAYAVALVISTAVSVRAALRIADRRNWAPRWAQWKTILRFGARTHVGNVLKFFQYRFDVVLIGALLDKRQVGLYVVGLSLSELPLRVPDAVGLVLFPKLAREGEGARQQEMTQVVSRHVFFLTLLSSSALFLAAPWVVQTLFGARFQDSSTATRILLPGGVALALWKVLAQDLIARGRPTAYSFSSFCSLVTMVVGCFVLVPPLGFTGAALASSAAYLTAATTLFGAYRRSTGARLRDCIFIRSADLALYRGGLARVHSLVGRRPPDRRSSR